MAATIRFAIFSIDDANIRNMLLVAALRTQPLDILAALENGWVFNKYRTIGVLCF